MKPKRQFVSGLFLVGLVGACVVGLVKDHRAFLQEMGEKHQIPSRRPIDHVEGTKLLARLPVAFIDNHGQWDSSVRFMARKGGMSAWLERDALTLQLRKQQAEGVAKEALVRLQFEGASKDVRLEGEAKQSGLHNYFLGNDPSKWHTQVPSYSSVRYSKLYEGIDLRLREQEGRLEYDLLLKPHAELKQVAIRAEGIQELELDEDGSLLMHTALGAIHQPLPSAWHELASGKRQPVKVQFVLLDKTRYGFEAPKRNKQLALLIDPGLVYSTYLGGTNWEEAYGIAVDSAGNAYVTGWTISIGFPVRNAFQPNHAGTGDAFITKLNPSQSGSASLIYSTYLGGLDWEEAWGIAVDRFGSAYVTGTTGSTNFPTTLGSFQPNNAGGYDAFVTKLSPSGSALLYSTYLGGSGTGGDNGLSIAVDSAGNAYVTGQTASSNFPIRNAAQPNYAGRTDAFITKLDPTQPGSASLIYSTYLGGLDWDMARGIAVDRFGSAYVTGNTPATNFPTTPGAFQPNYAGISDAFVTKLSPSGSALIYSTYLGGGGSEDGKAIAVDFAGNAYVAGQTSSSNFPTRNPVQSAIVGYRDAFITKLNPTGSGLVYSTFLGGRNSYEWGAGIAVDSAGSAYVAGTNDSPDFPTTPGAYDRTFNGQPYQVGIFVLQLHPQGSRLIYSTYLGPDQAEYGSGIALDDYGNAYVTGRARGPGFPTTPGAFQPNHAGGYGADAFFTMLDMLPTGASRYGRSSSGGTPGCPGTIAIGVDSIPQRGNQGFRITSKGAPPNTSGALVIGTGQDATGTPIGGITAHIDLRQPIIAVLGASSDALGYSEVAIPLSPALPAGLRVFAQFVWANTATCGGVGTASASDAFDITVQP